MSKFLKEEIPRPIALLSMDNKVLCVPENTDYFNVGPTYISGEMDLDAIPMLARAYLVPSNRSLVEIHVEYDGQPVKVFVDPSLLKFLNERH